MMIDGNRQLTHCIYNLLYLYFVFYIEIHTKNKWPQGGYRFAWISSDLEEGVLFFSEISVCREYSPIMSSVSICITIQHILHIGVIIDCTYIVHLPFNMRDVPI
jgi:hypothetical protein